MTTTDREAPEPLIVDEHDGVLLMIMNRPGARNALDQALTTAIQSAIAHLGQSEHLRVGVIFGGGGYFCAGVDLKAFVKNGMPKGLGELLMHGSPDKPLIA